LVRYQASSQLGGVRSRESQKRVAPAKMANNAADKSWDAVGRDRRALLGKFNQTSLQLETCSRGGPCESGRQRPVLSRRA
jgi:hypothetical protein